MNGPVGAWIARVYHTFAKIINEEHIWGIPTMGGTQEPFGFPTKNGQHLGCEMGTILDTLPSKVDPGLERDTHYTEDRAADFVG